MFEAKSRCLWRGVAGSYQILQKLAFRPLQGESCADEAEDSAFHSFSFPSRRVSCSQLFAGSAYGNGEWPVTHPSHAVVPGATVTLTDTTTF